MNEQLFIQAVTEKSREFNLNPLLLLSGIEGLYTFKDVQLGGVNYELLDSLILTIFALRIGDQFHTLAQEKLSSNNTAVQLAAINELSEISEAEIESSESPFLQSFARLLQGKSPVRKYHIKALEVAYNNWHGQALGKNLAADIVAYIINDGFITGNKSADRSH